MTDAAGLWTDDLALAVALGEEAAAVSLRELDQPLHVDTKADSTPVTNVDHAVDRMLISALRAQRPDDAILSEESGEFGRSSRRWILDPIDGTLNVVRGHPHWGNHIALEVDGEIVVGVITRPRLGLVWWASLGGGAFRAASNETSQPTQLRVSPTAEIADGCISAWTDDIAVIDVVKRRARWQEPDMNDILAVAEGRYDAVVESPGEIWDHAPNVLLVEEAGGRFRDHRGGHRIDIGPGHYTNGVIDLAAVIDA